jgi:hypothetical protein
MMFLLGGVNLYQWQRISTALQLQDKSLFLQSELFYNSTKLQQVTEDMGDLIDMLYRKLYYKNRYLLLPAQTSIKELFRTSWIEQLEPLGRHEIGDTLSRLNQQRDTQFRKPLYWSHVNYLVDNNIFSAAPDLTSLYPNAGINLLSFSQRLNDTSATKFGLSLLPDQIDDIWQELLKQRPQNESPSENKEEEEDNDDDEQ